jgi:hypothetical protein
VALRGYVFCVDNQISDGLARQGLSVPGSKESSGTDSVLRFYGVCQHDFHRRFNGQDSDRSGVTSIFFKNT